MKRARKKRSWPFKDRKHGVGVIGSFDKKKLLDLPAVKFSVAVECWPQTDSHKITVWESGRVLSLDGEKMARPVNKEVDALRLASAVMKQTSGAVTFADKLVDKGTCFTGEGGSGDKLVLILEYWTKIQGVRAKPNLSYRCFVGGQPGPDPGAVTIGSFPGMEKEAELVNNKALALKVAKMAFKYARWSIEHKKTIMLGSDSGQEGDGSTIEESGEESTGGE